MKTGIKPAILFLFMILCRLIRGKKLSQVKRLLEDLESRRRAVEGKYYTKAVSEFIKLLNSCEKNAESAGLDIERMFVHASASRGTIFRRRRRRAKFGNAMKNTHVEMILIEHGKEKKEKEPVKQAKPKKDKIQKEIKKLEKREEKIIQDEKALKEKMVQL